jgi:hypothetical protein
MLTKEYIELSRRIGKIIDSKTIGELSKEIYDDFISTIKRSEKGFQELPEKYKKIIKQAEEEKGTN